MTFKFSTGRTLILVCLVGWLTAHKTSLHAEGATYVPVNLQPPPVNREFRAGWIATVANIDWPSKPGLPVPQQKEEMILILDRAAKLNLNAVVLQVRPACDALYASKYEPWSYYLTGTMGKPPQPFYDPLTFAVEEAHKRGLELHAWFNPYRAALMNTNFTFSKDHISRTHPEMVVKYGSEPRLLWLDPGDKRVQDYSLKVIMDVVKRYDIDGVHFDDYFYPYKQNDAQKKEIDFPDGPSWKKYGVASKLSRENWRRENVNAFVHRVYDNIKAEKPWVKFGISPFGIWQPGHPPQIRGYNAYENLYCDARKWLANGWMDYCAPQLYWSIDGPEQSFPVLLEWWNQQNFQHRNIWPGLAADRVGKKWKPEEILNQVKITRNDEGGNAGEIFWSIKTLVQNRGGMGTALENGPFAEQALIPASPWLDEKLPGKPKLEIEKRVIKWKPAGFEKISAWVLQIKLDNQWHTRIYPGEVRSEINSEQMESEMTSEQPAREIVALTAIDRCGVASPPMVLQRQERWQKTDTK